MLIFLIRTIVLCYSFLLLLIPIEVNAQFTSSQSGDWDNCETWGFGGGCTSTAGVTYPDLNDNVIISSGHTVQIDFNNGLNGQDAGFNTNVPGSADIGYLHNGDIQVDGELQVQNNPIIVTGNVTVNGTFESQDHVLVTGAFTVSASATNFEITNSGRDLTLGGNANFTTYIPITIQDIIEIDGPNVSVCGNATVTVSDDVDTFNGSNISQICGTIAILGCPSCPINFNPNIEVKGNSTVIANNDITPSTTDLTDFGQVVLTNSTSNTFIISNTGTATLNLTGTPVVNITGSDAADFSVALQPNTTINAGNSVFYQVIFNPSTTGVKTAEIEIINDDPVNSTFTYSITGEALANSPEINITGNGQNILNNDFTPSNLDFTDFENVVVNYSLSHIFTIENIGSNNLSLTGVPIVDISGADAAEFSVSILPASSITPASNSSFQITFNPSSTGTKTARVTIINNDTDESTYAFDLQGTGFEFTSTQSGDWNDCETWGFGGGCTSIAGVTYPDIDDNVTINTGHTVLIDFNNGYNAEDAGINSNVTGSNTLGYLHNGDLQIDGTLDVNIVPIILTGDITIDGAFESEEDLFITGVTTLNASATNFEINGGGAPDLILGSNANFTTQIPLSINDQIELDGPNASLCGTASVTVGRDVGTFNGANISQICNTITILGCPSCPINTPVIEVKGNSTVIANNDITPSTTDLTDFGQVVLTNSTSNTFIISNTGTNTLNLTGTPVVNITGADAADFSVALQPNTTINGGNSAFFQVVFNPSTVGIKTAEIEIINDDPVNSTFTYSITGEAVPNSPEINITGNGQNILNNDFTPSNLDFTDFENVVVNNSLSHIFTIENIGSNNLSLTGVPIVDISGADAAEFSVSILPVSTISTASSSNFQITFNPSSTGTKTARVTIINNDTDEGTYAFDIQGTGFEFISTQSGDWNDCETWGFGGGCTSIAGVTFPDLNDNVTINTGHTVLIDFDNGLNGQDAGINSNVTGSADNGYLHNGSIQVDGTLSVENNPIILEGDITINGAFESEDDVFVVGTFTVNPSASSFDITNTGGDLTLGGNANFTTQIPLSIDDRIELDGPNASLCGTATVTISRDIVTQNGANISQICNTITILGCPSCPINTPVIEVKGNSTVIANNDITPSTTDLTDFGQVVLTNSTSNTFIISNTGTNTLNLTGAPVVNITGADVADFSVSPQPNTTINAGNSAFFQVVFNPSTVGIKTAEIEIINDDPTNPTFRYSITGEALPNSPEINITGNGQNILNNDFTPSNLDFTDFENVIVTNSLSHIFTIENIGSNNLSLTGVPTVDISGADAAEFSVSILPASTISSASSSNFQITFNPSSTGTKTARVTIINNDTDESTYAFDIQGTGIDSEINITGNSNNINNGDVATSTTNSTDFGNIMVGNNTVNTFTIENLGSSNLLLSGVPSITIIGADASEFSVTSAPSNTIGSGGSSNFDITFTPTSVGVKTANLLISNNDNDENPYNFAISGNGISPEINVTGNTVNITNGSLTPSTLNDTDFGSVRISQNISRTFTIENNGSSTLNLSGLPIVDLSGANAGDFSISILPSNTILAGNNTTFQVTFTPSDIGNRSATITIANDDLDENPFSFAISGNGIQPEMTVSGNGVTIANNDITPDLADFSDFGDARTDGQTVVRTFLIENNGTADLNINLPVSISGAAAADFSVNVQPAASVAPGGSSSFQVTFDPSAAGNRDAAIGFTSDDIADPNFSFAISGNGIQPAMTLSGNGVTIANNDITPDLADFSDFGDARTDGQTVVRTFLIENNGTADLNINLPVSISGVAAADFSINVQPAASVTPGGSTSFQVTFDPSAAGNRDAAIDFTSDDSADPNFSFAISGNGIQPEMTVSGNGVTIANNDITPDPADFSDFGDARTDGQTVVRTFLIENNGTADLNINLPVSISGAASADFSVNVQPAASVAPGGSTSFQVTFDPSTTGNRDASLDFTSDDSADPNFSFAISGNGIQPVMTVSGNGVTIANNDITPDLADFSDFGDVGTDGQTVVRTFRIENNGTADLNINLPVSISGAAAADFSVNVQPAASVAPGGSTSFQVTFDPSTTGNRDAAIGFTSDDIVDPNFSFAISGNGIQPVMTVSGNGVTIANNDITPDLADFSDFGDVGTDGQTVVRTFRIENNGTADLNINLPVSISGAAAADFSVNVQPTATLAPGGSTSFQVTFDPSATGNRDAVIGFTSDDSADPNFSFAISGNGIQSEMTVSGNGVTIANNDITPDLADFSRFGDARTDGQTVVRTFLIENNGTADLNINLPVSISGAAAADFSVNVQPAATVAPGGSTSFQVTFDPSVTGNRDATIGFTSDDSTDPSFSFAISGNGIQPAMTLSGNGVTIANNDITPDLADFSDFGDARTDGQTVVRTFLIENNGTADLNINLPVSISGAAAADFSVNVQPAATVTPGGSTSFQVTFDPSAAGNRDAAIGFTSDDSADPSFSFAISGNGIQPEMTVSGNGITIANNDITPDLADFSRFGDARTDGQTVVRTFLIENNGTADLNINLPVSISGAAAADFSVNVQPAATVAPGGSTSFQVTFDPSATGNRNAVIGFTSDDSADPNFSFAISGNGIQPEMAVSGNGVTIANNDITPDPADFSDFGDTRTEGQTVVRTFLIENNGTADLNINLPVSISGAAAADFSVNVQPAATVAPGESTSFQVTFDPSATGSRDAAIGFTSDDSADPNFSFAISGNGIQPEMTVSGNGVTIANNDITPDPADFSDFGDARTDGQTVVRTFLIENNGTADLNINLPVSISGATAADFSVNVQPAATVAPGGSTSFQVTFDPSAAGNRDATIDLISDDIADPNFSFAISGNGIQPEMIVSGNGVTIANNDITPDLADFSDFGNARTDGQTVVRTFLIENNGTADLNINLPVSISGAAAADFSVNVQPAATVAPGGSTSFQVTFDPSTTGNRDATIGFTSDDINLTPFTFDITGMGTLPIIVVRSNSNLINNGSLLTSENNNTFIGEAVASFETVEKTYYIVNEGNSEMQLTDSLVGIVGTNTSEFFIDTSNTNSVIFPGDSTSFRIRFTPISPGLKNASILIFSDDPTQNVYGFNLAGKGIEEYPVAEDDNFFMVKNRARNIHVQENDFHPSGLEITTAIVQIPSNGFANIDDNEIVYSPSPNFFGLDSIVYEVCDINNSCTEATLYINVLDDSKPIASDDLYSVITNTSLALNVQENDIAVSPDPLFTSVISAPVNGTFNIINSEDIEYIPRKNFIGSDILTYSVCNSDGYCDTANVVLNINTFNNKPLAINDTISTFRGQSINIDVLNNDINPNGGVLTLELISNTTNGNVAITNDNIFYNPEQEFVGTDQLIYRTCNNIDNCDTATVFINVLPKSPPITNADVVSTISGRLLEVNVLLNDTDNENNIDVTTATIIEEPNNGTITDLSNGLFEYQPSAFFVGNDFFTYEVCDSTQLCSTDTVFILVAAPESDLVKISKGFSPNGDNINDTWQIEGIEFFPRNVIKVFSKDGNIVYEATGYNNSNVFWDGRTSHPLHFGNGYVNKGTYFYIIDLGNGEDPRSGYLEIKY